MSLNLEQLRGLKTLNLLTKEQEIELERLEAVTLDAAVEKDEFNFETQPEAKKLFDDKVAFTQKILPEFQNESDRDDLVLTAMAACSGADIKNDTLLVVPDEWKKQVAMAIGSQAFGFVYSPEKLMTGVVKNKLMDDPKHKPSIALYEKELPNPFRPHTKDDARVNGLKTLGHIKVSSYLDDLDVATEKLSCFQVGTSAVQIAVLKRKINELKTA